MKKKPSRFVIPPSYFKEQESSPVAMNPNTVVSESVDPPPLENIEENIQENSGDIPSEIVPEVPERVIERPQILAERNAKKVSALSLKSIQKKQELKKELVANQPDGKNLPVNEFTEESMLEVWNEYSSIIEGEGKYNLLSHLSMGIPKLEGTIIHLEFPNHTIKLEVERARNELLGFIRQKLQNYDVSLSIEVNETAVKRYAYTTREKFEKLKEKNPLIDTLRQEFDLDI